MKIRDIIKRKKFKQRMKQWRDNKKCQNCKTTENLTKHHIILKSVGGSNNKSNLMVLCRKCHNKEHSSNPLYKDEHTELIISLRKSGYSFEQIAEWIDI